jgi:DNA-3-methyladenine glycosylase II
MHETIVKHFQSSDPVLFLAYKNLEKTSSITLEKSDDYFMSLCREITGQQLATKAASAIFSRFVDLFPERLVTPEHLLTIPDQEIRDVGTSWAKARYLKDIAQKVVHKEIRLELLDTLSDAEVITELTKIKGIGPWTAEMFLMFSLARPDVISFGDLGLQRAIQKLYGLRKKPTVNHMKKLSQKWTPYRTYACRILWDSLDNVPM